MARFSQPLYIFFPILGRLVSRIFHSERDDMRNKYLVRQVTKSMENDDNSSVAL